MKPLRVYFAGALARCASLQALAADLANSGPIQSTARWLSHGGTLREDSHLSAEDRTAWALRNLADIASSDLLVAFTEALDSPHRRGGRHAEVGAALALQRPVFLWGGAEHVFHYHPLVWSFPERGDLVRAVHRFALERTIASLPGPHEAPSADGDGHPLPIPWVS